MGLFSRKKNPPPSADSIKLHNDLIEEEERLKKKLLAQDLQLKAIQAAEEDYKLSGDLDALLCFWEDVWNNGGLLFNGSHWTFRLPDLYISIKQYDDALRILKKIKNPNYQNKKQSYIEKTTLLQQKKLAAHKRTAK